MQRRKSKQGGRKERRAEEGVAREMIRWGFKRGRYNPCLYYHSGLEIMTLVHGDDFMSVGSVQALSRFKTNLESRFEIKTQAIGPGDSVSRTCPDADSSHLKVPITPEGRVLNRVVRWTEDGWEVEPDQRHVDILVQELALVDARPVGTPGESESKAEDDESE